MKKKNGTVIPLLCMFIGYCIDILYVLLNGKKLINSDSSSEMILADILNHKGGVITNQWFYSSEIRVLNTQLGYRLALFLLPDNWHRARVLAIALFLLILAFSAIYMSISAGLGNKGLWGCCALMFPFGQWYAWNVLYNSFYIPHIAISFLSIGLLLHLDKEKSGKIKELVRIILMVLLAFVAGLGGTRQLMMCYGPIFIAAVIIFVHSWKKREIFSREEIRYEKCILERACIQLVSAMGGYLVNIHFLALHFRYTNYADTQWNQLDLSHMLTCISDFLALFGWQENVNILSVRGLVNVAGLIMIIATIYFLIKLILMCDQLNVVMKFMSVFTGVAAVTLLMVFSQTSVYNSSYWVPIIPFFFFILTSGMEEFVHSKICGKEIRRFGYIAYMTTIIGCSYSTMVNPYISWVPNDKAIIEPCEWLEERGYTKGYASFWNSNILTELANGKIEMWTVDDMNNLHIYEWLQATEHVKKQPDGKFFIIISNDEYISAPSLEITSMQDHLVYEDGNYYVYSFNNLSEYMDMEK